MRNYEKSEIYLGGFFYKKNGNIFARKPPAIAFFIWLLPHFSIPAVAAYRPPAAAAFLVLWAFTAIVRPRGFRMQISSADASRMWGLFFFFCCIISSVYGYWNLESEGKTTLSLTTGAVGYVNVIGERILQIVLMLVALEVVYQSQYSSRQLMRWWLQGMCSAVFLHVLTYAITSNDLLQRSGTFTEGNLAGLYYILSVFIALEYKRAVSARFSVNKYFFVALLGVFLSRSTAGLILLAFLMSIEYTLSARSRRVMVLRIIILFLILPSVFAGMFMTGQDFGIREKLFEEEVTAQSFSRIDRLESINVAAELFLTAPLFGHGLQTYGFLSTELLSGPLQAVYDGSFRRIPNNIYAELASEMGLIGLTLFLLFVLSLIRLAASRTGAGRMHWLLGLAGVVLYWNAFPTYSVIFIWVFFGLIVKTAYSYTSPSMRSMV